MCVCSWLVERGGFSHHSASTMYYVVLAFVIRNASGLPLAASPATREREKREREGDEVTAKYSPLVVARALLP